MGLCETNETAGSVIFEIETFASPLISVRSKVWASSDHAKLLELLSFLLFVKKF